MIAGLTHSAINIETMSENSKMVLFGSKDRNTKEQKQESTKSDSPDRYAPYCIDSDSETYDTEALSMMDINDIIGVQSDPVGDSTLESEIAALSQIITESKTDVSQNAIETKTETSELSVPASSEAAHMPATGLGKTNEISDSIISVLDQSTGTFDNQNTQNTSKKEESDEQSTEEDVVRTEMVEEEPVQEEVVKAEIVEEKSMEEVVVKVEAMEEEMKEEATQKETAAKAVMEKEMTEEKMTEYEAAEEVSTKVEMVEEKAIEHLIKAETVEEKLMEEEALEGKAVREETMEAEPVEEEPAKVETVEEEPMEGLAVEEELAEIDTVEGEPMEAPTVEKEPAKVETVEEQPPEAETVEEEPTEAETVEEEPMEAEMMEVETAEEEPIEAETVEEEHMEAEPTEAETVEEEPTEAETVEEEPTEAETMEEELTEAETMEVETAGEEPTEADTVEEEPADAETMEEEPAEAESVEEETVEEEPVEEEPVEEESVEEEPGEAEPVEEESVEAELAEEEPVEAEPAEEEPADTEPAEEEPADTEPVEEVSTEVEAVEDELMEGELAHMEIVKEAMEEDPVEKEMKEEETEEENLMVEKAVEVQLAETETEEEEVIEQMMAEEPVEARTKKDEAMDDEAIEIEAAKEEVVEEETLKGSPAKADTMEKEMRQGVTKTEVVAEESMENATKEKAMKEDPVRKKMIEENVMEEEEGVMVEEPSKAETEKEETMAEEVKTEQLGKSEAEEETVIEANALELESTETETEEEETIAKEITEEEPVKAGTEEESIESETEKEKVKEKDAEIKEELVKTQPVEEEMEEEVMSTEVVAEEAMENEMAEEREMEKEAAVEESVNTEAMGREMMEEEPTEAEIVEQKMMKEEAAEEEPVKIQVVEDEVKEEGLRRAVSEEEDMMAERDVKEEPMQRQTEAEERIEDGTVKVEVEKGPTEGGKTIKEAVKEEAAEIEVASAEITEEELMEEDAVKAEIVEEEPIEEENVTKTEVVEKNERKAEVVEEEPMEEKERMGEMAEEEPMEENVAKSEAVDEKMEEEATNAEMAAGEEAVEKQTMEEVEETVKEEEAIEKEAAVEEPIVGYMMEDEAMEIEGIEDMVTEAEVVAKVLAEEMLATNVLAEEMVGGKLATSEVVTENGAMEEQPIGELTKEETGEVLEEKSGNIDAHPDECISSDNVGISMLTKAEELEEKQELEENLKADVERNNLKSILEETANNVAEMFSEEQCQNTQDIVTSILDDVRNVTDFKNILGTESVVENEIEEVLQRSGDLPLVEAEIEELAEKLPEDSEDILEKAIEDPIAAQNIDSLEGLLGLDLIPETEDAELKAAKPQGEAQERETLEKDVEMRLLLEESNRRSDIAQASDYITDVISSCLTSGNDMRLQRTTDKSDIVETVSEKADQAEDNELLKVDEYILNETIEKDSNVDEIQKGLEVDAELPGNDLDMDFEENPLESVGDLEGSVSKLDLAPDILLQNVDTEENLNDTPSGIETSQPSSEISELESAVKFLQESEEQAIDSPLVLSPKMVESVVEDISKQTDPSSLFVPDEDMCEDAAELVAELQSITRDSIAISEAEIISEAAKLENERKLVEQGKIRAAASMSEFEETGDKLNIDEIKDIIVTAAVDSKLDEEKIETMELLGAESVENARIEESVSSIVPSILKPAECIPKVSILEERLKEPPKIEIPSTDVTKVLVSPSASKDSLLIQKDAKLVAYQKMLESPKLVERSEPKPDTPRKDSEKHEFENVGSPRIILKIAKSAIADCSEPRSPKSPKIRSATNSPNPEDSPGQKLGKIKLKLSKGGHPSIISNENVEEAAQWHSESAATSSLSPIGMKIKLSKSGDASIVPAEKYEAADESIKDMKHKFEEAKRTESPIGMKIKLSKTGDASIVQDSKETVSSKHKDKLDIVQGSPKRTESPIGMKIKLSKSGDASIVQPDKQESLEEYKDSSKQRDLSYDSPKRTDSPIGMKIKLSKTGDASIVSPDPPESRTESPPDLPKRTESPIGMKIKLSKTKGGASIISVESTEDTKDKLEVPDVPKRTESPLGMKIKLSKTGDASIIHSELAEEIKESKLRERIDSTQDFGTPEDSVGLKIKVPKLVETRANVQESADESEAEQETPQKVESPLGMKIKLSKFGDVSIIATDKQQESAEESKITETPKRTESPLGMKIKLSKTGDASIVQSEVSEESSRARTSESDHPKTADPSLAVKIKLLKTGDGSIIEPEKKERQPRRRETESPLEMKIKLSKTGHPTIVACDTPAESSYKSKEAGDSQQTFPHRYKEPMMHKEPALKILKSGHSTILQSNRSELTIEPVQMQGKKVENVIEISPKRKEITISPIEPKKSKLETQLSQILPEVTIQPVMSRDQKQLLFDPKTSLISRQQMSVISQEISITQVRPTKNPESSVNEKLKDILSKNVTNSPLGSDCEIIEHRPELIIVNENSNSSQDVVIIEEVPPNRLPEVKVPKKRGRPRRNPVAQPAITHPPPQVLMPRDPLALDETATQPAAPVEQRENERPKRTCRSQKSYAPPKRGRGRGRGKRKLEPVETHLAKKPRIDQDLTAIEASTMGVITMDASSAQQEPQLGKSPELYKALKQPAMDTKGGGPAGKPDKQSAGQKDGRCADSVNIAFRETAASTQTESGRTPEVQGDTSKMMPKPAGSISLDPKDTVHKRSLDSERMQRKVNADERVAEKPPENAKENKEILVPPGHPNWLTPTSKRQAEPASRHENMSTVQVIDEETRMSAESGSRSQTPARNLPVPASETIINEESQGSVLSTATTESEKVKVKNRRMEINFDPDEGPFTVDKIAEYEWPLDRKGETFMIQEQISQYLGVKSFKRKYPDLKRRMVDMEERNYLRENGLVSEAMCDMGLTAVCSSEVLDVMCSDFPDQYEEYRKHMREKQVKEHSKKQKELSAAANAEKNRIDLAEMAVQSALTWNINLNKARRENRKCSLDLQTFTIHVPKKQQKVEIDRKVSHYPVALIPGQYTDYYREYTAAELRYYPLNTVLYGPMRPNERKFDSQSEGSQSDSDSESSSDDSSSSSSEGTQDTEGSQSTMDEVDMEIASQKDEVKLKCKMCLKTLNKHSKTEVLIQCGTCNGNVHPSCIDLTLDMVPHIQSYAWQCTDCKTCAQCHDPADEDKMLFCDMCDRGYHIYCVGLRRVPQGRWHCQECAVCANCGSREPGGVNSDRNSVAQWQHEFKKGDKNTRVYVSTLCVPCSKLWRKGRYCPHCSRCHTAPRLDLEPNLVHCSACDKYLHLGCVETKGMVFDRKNYLCDFCAPNRQQVVKPVVSKPLKT